MIEQEVNKVSLALKEEKDRLIVFFKDRMSTIVFPENNTIVGNKQDSPTATNEKTPLYLLGGGALGLIVGLCVKATAISVLGGAACAVGAYMYFNNKNVAQGGDSGLKQENRDFDYSRMSNNIYKTLESAHSHISKEWDTFLSQQNNILVSAIRSSDLDEDKKSELIDKVITRSLIDFSMMDAFTELNSISKTKDVLALKRTTDSIVEKYVAEIGRACDEQLSTYASL